MPLPSSSSNNTLTSCSFMQFNWLKEHYKSKTKRTCVYLLISHPSKISSHPHLTHPSHHIFLSIFVPKKHATTLFFQFNMSCKLILRSHVIFYETVTSSLNSNQSQIHCNKVHCYETMLFRSPIHTVLEF